MKRRNYLSVKIAYASKAAICFLALTAFSGCYSPDDQFKGIRYRAFSLKNYTDAKFFVPSTEKIPAVCEKLDEPTIEKFQRSLGDTRDFSVLKNECVNKNMTCADLKLQGKNSARFGFSYLRAPLFSIEQWDKIFPDIPIKINAMFYEVEFFSNFPHLMPCTNSYGFSKASDGKEIGNLAASFPFDVMVVEESAGKQKLRLATANEVGENPKILADAKAALSGFVLLRNGEFVFQTRRPPQFPDFDKIGYCDQKHGRVALGLKGQDLWLYVGTNIEKDKHGITCKELADLAHSKYGVTDLILFDGGGSLSLWVKDPVTKSVLHKTPPFDKQGYRPIPGFFGITPANMNDFSLVADEDRESD